MSSAQKHEAYDYAERVCERLPRRLQELREAAGMSKYALAKKAGVSRDMVGCIEEGESIPTLPPCCGTFRNFFRQMRLARAVFSL